MKKLSKKKKVQITQWFLSILFMLFLFQTRLHWSSIVLIISAVLMAPIKPVRRLLSKLKIKNGLAMFLSLVLFFTAFGTNADHFQTDDEVQGSAHSSQESSQDSEGSSSVHSNSILNNEAHNNQTSNGLSGSSSTPSESKLPQYKGQPYAVINSGKPYFTKAQLTTKAYEKYSPLDSLGRCQAAIASLGTETMPKDGEKRGSISSVYPSGWRQARYDGISSKDLYNRCHLIGWQLSAENANPSNLITGTRYMNVDGMLPFENMVADYIKETKNHVAYRVTPIYIGNNLVASGVQIEAYSIEDNGDGICFNVYCFNVQPNIKINYANGESSGPNGAMLKPHKPSSDNKSPNKKPDSSVNKPSSQSNKRVYITPNGKCYHYDKQCAGKNAIEKNFDDVKNSYKPCGTCVH